MIRIDSVADVFAYFRKRSARMWAAEQREHREANDGEPPMAMTIAELQEQERKAKELEAARSSREKDVMWEQFADVMELDPTDPRYQALRPILLQIFDEKAMGASA